MKMFKTIVVAATAIAVLGIAKPCVSGENEPKTVEEILEKIRKEHYPNGFPSDQFSPMPFEFSIRPDSKTGRPGPTILGLIIQNNWCESMSIRVAKIDKLEYAGTMSWSLDGKPGDTFSFQLNIGVPVNDTGEIEFELKCDSIQMPFSVFYVSSDEDFKLTQSNPRRKNTLGTRKLIDMSDPVLTEEQRQGTSSVGYYDEEKNWVPEDSVKNGLSPSGKRVGNFNAEGIFISLDSLHKLGSNATYDSTTNVIEEGDRSKTWLVNKDGSRVHVDRAWLLDSLKQAKVQAGYEEMCKPKKKRR